MKRDLKGSWLNQEKNELELWNTYDNPLINPAAKQIWLIVLQISKLKKGCLKKGQ